MDFISQLFDPSQSSFDPLNFIGILGTIFVSIYIFKKQAVDPFAVKRHYVLISPLFDILEPVLYQKDSSAHLSHALQLIETQKSLADGKLLEHLYLCTQKPSHQNFINLCAYVDKSYDKSCRSLGLKTRSISYRIQRKQYKNFACLCFYLLPYLMYSIFLELLSLLIFILILSILIAALFFANTAGRLIVLLAFVTILLGLIKLLYEKN